jgi:hypothetical protein
MDAEEKKEKFLFSLSFAIIFKEKNEVSCRCEQ